ncbi:MAG TPA: hypothetical protein VK427_18200 [Kofleriaceae bacterium]|nr:hypothetical protein [Kofleriaceae bacterium]
MIGRLVVCACAALLPAAAHADDNDLVLGRLVNATDDGRFVPQNAELRTLASELGVVLAPHMLTPADTLGFGGFQMTVDYTTTTIDADASHWRARQGTETPSALSTVGLFARKGMWFPVPSFEIGAGATHLVDSNIWTAQLYTKLAFVEGYHDLPIPSVAARGAVSRMMTQRELDLTVASFDLTASKHFGIGGTWRLDPFVGWNLLMIIPRSEVIDPTPNVDPLAPGNDEDAMNSFVFKDQDIILRHRFSVGMKLQFSVVQLTVEGTFALAGTSKDDRSGTNVECMAQSTTTACDAKDSAAAQRTISASAGVDF